MADRVVQLSVQVLQANDDGSGITPKVLLPIGGLVTVGEAKAEAMEDAGEGTIVGPPVISNVVATPGADSCEFTWDTDLESTSHVLYRAAGESTWTKTDDSESGVTSHTVTVEDLDEATAYEFMVESVESDYGTVGTSDVGFFATASAAEGLVISNVVPTPTPTGCTITADVAGASAPDSIIPVVFYGEGAVLSAGAYARQHAGAGTTSVTVELSGLDPETVYNFMLTVTDTNADPAVSAASAPGSFTTTAS